VPPSGPQFHAPGISSGGKTVALTFDDGPGPSTQAILSILESFQVPATFFNIGVHETKWPGDVRAEATDGFLIGNHTWNHPDMTTLSSAGQAAEMDQVIQEQESLTGTSPCVFRPPYGDYDPTTLSLASQRHMAVWMWTVDTEDWEAEGSGSSYWVNRIISLAESEGGVLSHPVVLMHNQAIPMPATVAALPIIIRYFQSHGYTFIDLLGRTGLSAPCGSAPRPSPRPPSAVLEPGRQLRPGASMQLPGRQFRLVMQLDGNLVLYSASEQALWMSGTRGVADAWASMQRDGNFVVYSRTGRAVWASGTAKHPGAQLALQANGNVVVYDSKGVLWSTASKDSRLLAGERLEPGWYLESPSGLCRLLMQRDGNLVLYSASDQALWASSTRGVAGAWASMQRDGNFVIYSRTGRAVWATGTAQHPGAQLTLTDSAQLVVTSPSGAMLWSTG
jgi:peptidoglycan/xylan/chitin deacetylase (PgdA/CDA1 family)